MTEQTNHQYRNSSSINRNAKHKAWLAVCVMPDDDIAHRDIQSRSWVTFEFTCFMQSAHKTDSIGTEEKFIIFLYSTVFFPNKENANVHFMYLTYSLEKYQRTKSKFSRVLFWAQVQHKKKGTTESWQ